MRASLPVAQTALLCWILAGAAHAQVLPGLEPEPVGGGEPIRIFPEWHRTDFSHEQTPIFTFTTDFPILTRTNAGAQPFVYGTGGAVLLDAGDIGLSTEGALRLDFIFYDESGWDLEFAYLGTEDFSATETRADRNIVPYFYQGYPVDPARSYVVNYESNLHGMEFNVRKRCGAHVTLLAGLRALQLHEGFDILRGDNTTMGFYSKTYNHLWGGQVGGDFRWWLNGIVAFTATVKGGAYNNNIEIYGTALDSTGESEINMYHNTSEAAFFGEVTAGVVISMGHYAALRFGYMALVTDGIALAPDQSGEFDLFTGDGTAVLGSPAYHGGYVGFEVTY